MKKINGDTVRFEDRAELGLFIKALEMYMDVHKNEDQTEIRKICHILDAMEFDW